MGVIVVGYDDSPGARHALDVTAALAGPLGDRVVVAFAARPPGRPGEEFRAHQRALAELGQRFVSGAVERLQADGIEVEGEVAVERDVDLLVRLATEREARMIVVGSYGETPLRSALVGATPHKLLQLSSVPVLVVPAAAEGGEAR